MRSRADFMMFYARRGDGWPGLGFSLLLHGAMLLALAAIWRAPVRIVPAIEWPAVEIVDEPALAPSAVSSRPEQPVPAPSDNLAPPEPAPDASAPSPAPLRIPAAPNGAIRAERMLSHALLAGPYGIAMKRELGRMEGETRTVQLCNIEAMAQIDQLQPDGAHARRVVAYARSVPERRRAAIAAPGAAVDLRGRWLRLGYTCELDPEGGIVGFEFRLGGEIRPEDWERFSLPPPGRKALD